jgi:hypothetical protein
MSKMYVLVHGDREPVCLWDDSEVPTYHKCFFTSEPDAEIPDEVEDRWEGLEWAPVDMYVLNKVF